MAITLFILNDAPYGNERAYNVLRQDCLCKSRAESTGGLLQHPTGDGQAHS